jgi:hypothetical protein
LRRAVRHSGARGFLTRLDDYRKFSVTSQDRSLEESLLAGRKLSEKIDDRTGGAKGRTDGGNRPNRRNVEKALAAGASTYALRREMGNALVLAKLCGTQSVMSTAFALHSLPPRATMPSASYAATACGGRLK